ncbi:1-deoxy-D-xylulose-5-phosphate synthase [Epidermidibacterium keratini]|uniref:1-deoxy-D-xylulose-5-phosphate synthase n=1 Tax=Epidermidibacterium keratini TaxID=1891644 RepID=A0A7L4YTZ9_9ACTN|nr:1-deoxy-D-xylulose-5-phosphate synthase [Epidermidibacterium keratini]
MGDRPSPRCEREEVAPQVSKLSSIDDPDDLRALPPEELPALAEEIREFLVSKVSRSGGHLGPNLGVVELTLALHRVFDSPREPIVWDTGHQAYVHKMLTGRQDGFDELKRRGGLSGYPSRSESEHDWSESSHASASLSYVDGLAKAFEITGDPRPVVGVIGDGALTGGMAWEALNNIAESSRPVVIVVNDNGWSYQPTIGGVATRLAALRLTPTYERTLGRMKETISKTPVVGGVMYDALHGMKVGIKDVLAPQGMFSELGLKYVGPVDGHDVAALERALRLAKDFGSPVIVHAVTQKGKGYGPAEADKEDRLHGPGAFDVLTGKALAAASTSWTDVFADEMVEIGTERADVAAITAAMLYPTGLAAFKAKFPGRTFDVGIAEQHALTSAAGMAMAGVHPVVALYSTFLNRAIDQLIMDIALHRLGVTICLDRAGVTGNDGPSHNGVWDMALVNAVPGIHIGAPRDGARLRALLREAVDIEDAPTLLRWNKGSLPPDTDAVRSATGYDVLSQGPRPDLALVSIGGLAPVAVEAAELLAERGISVTVYDPRWVVPVAGELIEELARHSCVVTLEDGLRQGGIGSAITQALRDQDTFVPTREVGLPCVFPDHASRGEVLAEFGLDAQSLSDQLATWYARQHGPHSAAPVAVSKALSEGD